MKYLAFAFSFFITQLIVNRIPVGHSDVKELGLKGNVKTMTQYRFRGDSISKKDSIYFLKNKNAFEYKRVYFFSRVGNLDSIISYYNYSNNNALANRVVTNFLIYNYNNDNKKTGFSFYGENRMLEQQGVINWTDKTKYSQITYAISSDGKRNKIEETNFQLTDEFRELSYEVRGFGNPNETLTRQYFVTNHFGLSGLLQKKIVEYKVGDNRQIVEKYKYQKMDKFNNPLETLQLLDDEITLRKFVLTEYSYY